MLEKLFKLKENGTTVKTEVIGGITTFMTMAYILAVNPTILSAAGMDKNAILMATALSAFIGTFVMALLANYPFALAPGLSAENEEKLCQLISEARISGMSREDFVKVVDKYFLDRRG